MAPNGYCLFAVSDKTAANIITSGTIGELSFTLCLNGSSAISCQNFTRTLTGSLVTVGYYRSNSGQLPISYISNNAGKSWTLSNDGILPLMPLPADARVPNNANAFISQTICSLSGLNCTSEGVYSRGTASSGYTTYNGTAPLSYTSNNGGQTWALSSGMVLPSNVLQTSDSINQLYSITCDPSGLKCTAVGYYTMGVPPNYTTYNGKAPLSYTSNNGGQTWALSSGMVLPSNVLQTSNSLNGLNSITCDPSGLKCTAVGYYTMGVPPNYTTYNGTAPLSYSSSNGGQTWALSDPLPRPSNAQIGQNSLLSITCDTSGQYCTALGFYLTTNNGGTQPLGYTSNNSGKTWALSNQGNLPLLPLPTNTVQGINASAGFFSSVSCDETGLICIATSSYRRGQAPTYATSIGRVPMGYTSTNGGQTWTLSQMPPPTDSWQSADSGLEISSPICDTTGQLCTVVGGYYKALPPNYSVSIGLRPFSYTSSNGGKTWALSNQGAPLPLPADAALDDTNTATDLYSVFCHSLQCVAVGEYSYIGSTNGNTLSLAYTSKDRGNTWVLSSTLALPSDSSPIPNTGLDSVN